MKKILLIMTALVLSLGAQAQLLNQNARAKRLERIPWERSMEIKAPVAQKAPMKAITLGEGQMWWGYFSESQVSSLPFDGFLGVSSAASFDLGIAVPANHPIVGGAKIKGLRFWIGSDISKINSDVTVWVSKTQPTDISAADYKQVIPRAQLQGKLNEVEFTTPFAVNNSEIYAGFSFSISGAAYPLMSTGDDEENAYLLRLNGGDWWDMAGNGYGVLAMQLLLDDVSLVDYGASPSDFDTEYVQKGGSVSIPVKVSNVGNNAITSLSYTITTNGTASAEQSMLVPSIASGASADVSFTFPADAEPRKYDKVLTITKVNGSANETTQNTANGQLITIASVPTPVPVIEEFTGTWCGWCTIGLDGMKSAHEKYGDKAVLLAGHAGDEMQCDDYVEILDYADGYPDAIMDRMYSLYPSADNLSTYIDYQIENRITVGTITAKAEWASDAKETIKVNTETEFVYSDDSGNYGIAYILSEDGMSDPSWVQQNYLSGRAGYESTTWYSLDAQVSGVIYDHVVVAAWQPVLGVDGSVASTFAAGAKLTYTFDADITSKPLIQDKTKLKIAALLIDRNTGRIVNATQVAIDDATAPTGIAINEVNFPDDNFRAWLLNSENILGRGEDALLTDDEIADITYIDVSRKEIADLKGIEFFTALDYLSCSDNQLTALDVSKNTALAYLSCGDNQLTALDVSKNTALGNLHCKNNQLTSLDVSKNTKLKLLSCDNNQLTSLDVSKNTDLKNLYCSDNQLTSLDVSNNTALEYLLCKNNQLTSLDLSKNTELMYLDCHQNQLTSLDVSMLPNLKYLNCNSNQLSTLDVSKNSALEQLFCYQNQLTALDVSANNTALYYIVIYNNNINETEMGKLVESLPTVTPSGDRESGTLVVIDKMNGDNNVISTEQVAAAKAKNWKVQAFVDMVGSSKKYEDYEGTTPVGIDTLIAQPSRNQSIFNVAGQQQSTLRRGVNIVGGKKVLVK